MNFSVFRFRSKILLGILILFTIITGLIAAHRAQKGSNDFDTFYYAGQAVRSGEGIYYSEGHGADQKRVSPFLYPPAAACFFALWALLPLQAAAFFWNAFNVMLLVLNSRRLFALTQTSWGQFKEAWVMMPRMIQGILVVWTVVLVLDNLTMAQMNIWVFFLTLASFQVHQNQRPLTGGMLLAAAVMMKVTPLIFLPYFLIRKDGRFLAGFILGSLFLTLLIPSLVFGWDNNRIYHRQFLGRTLKPIFISWDSKINFEIDEPVKKAEEIATAARLSNCLTDKNQSLEASLTRLLLKERHEYEIQPYAPASVKKYHALPILAGGIPRERLFFVIRIFQGMLVFALLAQWFRNRWLVHPLSAAFDCALGFLALTLLSPALRSQQYIVWLFPFFLFILSYHPLFGGNQPKSRVFQNTLLVIAFLLFTSQAHLYGRAAGMGTWANLLLWSMVKWMGAVWRKGRGTENGARRAGVLAH